MGWCVRLNCTTVSKAITTGKADEGSSRYENAPTDAASGELLKLDQVIDFSEREG